MKPAESSSWNANRQSAFTRIDLLVIVLTLGFLALMLLPALARTHVRPQGAQCLYNLRQIILAWQMYADDSNGKLAPNHGAFPANPDYSAPSGATYIAKWVNGNMRSTSSIGPPYTIDDPNNQQLLVDPTYSALGNYVKNPKIYRCPADLSTWTQTGGAGPLAPLNGTEQPRVRSYSMNQGVGCAFNGTRQDPGFAELGHWMNGAGSMTPYPWQTYIKNSDLSGALAPSDLFVMVEEHPDSINDAAFAVYMPTSSFDPGMRWIDVPAVYHLNGSDFSFADGHVEFHKWIYPGTIPPMIWAADTASAYGNGAIPPTGPDQDLLWLARHTSFNTKINGWPGY